MCLRCDGYSEEQVRRALDLTILTHGFAIQQVDSHRPWTYTIGLLEGFGHPELITVDLALDAQRELLAPLLSMITGTGALDPRWLTENEIEVVPVHEDHLASSLVAMWSDHYGRGPHIGTFLQVLPPASWLCAGHGHVLTRLDAPGPGPASVAPHPQANRAARRARRRR